MLLMCVLGLPKKVFHQKSPPKTALIGCDDDPGEVLLGDFRAGGEGAPASLEAAEDILNQGANLPQAAVSGS